MTLHQLPIANKERVIIVGAGIGGLAASLRLSHMGYNVKVFETAETAGGKLRTITGQTGEIDIGPTVLTLLPVFQNLFRSVGEDIFDHIELVRQKIIARHWWPDGETLDPMTTLNHHEMLYSISVDPSPQKTLRSTFTIREIYLHVLTSQ